MKHIFAEIKSPICRSDYVLDVVQNLSIKIPVIINIYNFSFSIDSSFYIKISYFDHSGSTEPVSNSYSSSPVLGMEPSDASKTYEKLTPTQKLAKKFKSKVFLKLSKHDFIAEENYTRLDTFVDMSPIGEYKKGSTFTITLGLFLPNYRIVDENFIEICDSVEYPFYTKPFV